MKRLPELTFLQDALPELTFLQDARVVNAHLLDDEDGGGDDDGDITVWPKVILISTVQFSDLKRKILSSDSTIFLSTKNYMRFGHLF